MGFRSYRRSRREPPPRAHSPGSAAELPPPVAGPQSAACDATAASRRSSPLRAPVAAWDGVVMGRGVPLVSQHAHLARQSSTLGQSISRADVATPRPSNRCISPPPHPHCLASAVLGRALRHTPDKALVHHGVGQHPHRLLGKAQPLHLLLT